MSFYYRTNEENHGPVSAEELAELFKQGTITADTLVIEEGAAAWSTYAELFPPKPQAPTKPAPRPVIKRVVPTLTATSATAKPKAKSSGILPLFSSLRKGAFFICYVMATVMLLGALLALGVCLLRFIFSSDVRVPDFDTIQPKLEQSASSKDKGTAEATPNPRLSKIEDAIRKVYTDLSLDNMRSEAPSLASDVAENVQIDNTETWLDGWEDCMEDTIDYCKERGYDNAKREEMCRNATTLYASRFVEKSGEPEKMMNYVLYCLVALMFALPLPVLLRIEHNTRKQND